MRTSSSRDSMSGGYGSGGYGYGYDPDATLPYSQRSRRPRGEGSPGRPRPPRPRRTNTRPLKRRRWPRRLLKTVAVVIVLLTVVFGGLWLVTPSVSQAPSLVQQQAVQHGISYPGIQPPQRFTEALVATEDHRFYSNPGVDPLAIARLFAGDLIGRSDQGGSTLEQQLAKNLYTQGRSGISVEAEQVMLAIKLNMTYTKAQILQMYAEVAYYGNNYYGLRAASCGYFGTEPAQLSWPEAALLAGVVNAPTIDDPRTNPQNARAREAHVVGRLVAVGDLTPAQGKLVLDQRLNLVDTGCAS
ncbi:MAG: transglycosylase domain-containing protein [Streptosporangiaceae bacterium]